MPVPTSAQPDVVVLGTGAAGLVAALRAHDSGARVLVLEKSDEVGGTTAVSGGIVWVPANPYAARAGVQDSVEDGITYLMSLSHGMIDPAMARTLVETGPDLCTWLDDATPVHLQLVEGFPDYQPEHPGGLPGGGRSLECALFPFPELGEWADRVRAKPQGRHLLLREGPLGGGTGIVDPALVAERADRDERGTGQALVGALLKACLDRGIEPILGARAERLLVEDGRVRGVRVRDGEDTVDVRAGAVVLATGGFEWDEGLVKAFLRGPMSSPASPPTSTGDGLRMAMRAGAALGTMREAWWGPVMDLPGEDGRVRTFLCNRERTLPRSLMVNRKGVRFVNEAANYNAFGGAFHAFDPTTFDYSNLPCWLVFDAEYLRRYGFALLPPGAQAPEWMVSGETVEELAASLGVPADALAATVSRFNELVDGGRDTDFGRGDSAYDAWSGDRSRTGRDCTLDRIDAGPYYAVEILSGCLGTKGGPLTDADGRVLDVDGDVIDGLFAAGNVMAGATGMTYGGAGGTLGPAMVFGYRAGMAAAAAVAPAGASTAG